MQKSVGLIARYFSDYHAQHLWQSLIPVLPCVRARSLVILVGKIAFTQLGDKASIGLQKTDVTIAAIDIEIRSRRRFSTIDGLIDIVVCPNRAIGRTEGARETWSKIRTRLGELDLSRVECSADAPGEIKCARIFQRELDRTVPAHRKSCDGAAV